jgi:hypothetical protein
LIRGQRRFRAFAFVFIERPRAALARFFVAAFRVAFLAAFFRPPRAAATAFLALRAPAAAARFARLTVRFTLRLTARRALAVRSTALEAAPATALPASEAADVTVSATSAAALVAVCAVVDATRVALPAVLPTNSATRVNASSPPGPPAT